jgi:hypothetical protein
MKILRLLLPTAVLGLAVVFTFPRASIGFVTLGKTNNADNIGFQVFQSSFTDAASNNNTTPDANFPGATGAAMALWKAACEWNSELRGGNGNGDPAQPGDLGSGNSNYDFMYEGVANNAGGNTSAVITAGGFLGNGVFAVTLTGFNNGWSMTFDNSPNNGWNWVDGPGNETGGLSVDIQGIGTHELGHSLGLGHSADGTATMFASTTPGGSVGLRTIAPDDIAGVQAIYQVKSGTKPKITGLSGNIFIGGVMTITGLNFSLTNNEVWFTKNTGGATQGPPMTPVKVTNLGSTSGGTMINVTIPAGVADGDVIVHSSGQTSLHTLKSAPFPFDLGTAPTFPIINTLSPNPIATLASPVPVLTLSGTNFTGATNVKIGAKTYTAGFFSVVNDQTITLDFNPPPVDLGTVNVTVTSPLGTSAVKTLQLSLPANNCLIAESTNPSAGSNVNFFLGAPVPGETALVAYSQCIQPTSIAPYVSFSIGGCGDLDFLNAFPTIGANGIATLPLSIPTSFHGVVFLQFARIDLANPIFPLTTSNFALISVP